MTGHPIRRTVAVVAAATLTATLAATALATEVEAAKPKPRCQGKVATIVGTKKNDIIRGTAKRDVIVAKGGNDRIYGKGGNDLICAGTGNDRVFGGVGADTIWGQFGHDTLNGNAGPDFVAGQVGNDTLNGGIDVDTCYQGTGAGSVSNCELPAPPPPPPPPPPEPPTLVIAYTDINTNHVYDTGDVMIAKIVDTVADGTVGPGDTIKMGQYPTSSNLVKPAQLRSQFEDWKVKEHAVATADLDAATNAVEVQNGSGDYFRWVQFSATHDWEEYEEWNTSFDGYVWDHKDEGVEDGVVIELASPSQATSAIDSRSRDGVGDDGLIDVDFAPGV